MKVKHTIALNERGQKAETLEFEFDMITADGIKKHLEQCNSGITMTIAQDVEKTPTTNDDLRSILAICRYFYDESVASYEAMRRDGGRG